jgi:hypothetical protein
MGVLAHGAKVVHKYSQGQELPQMNLDHSTKGGVCASIASYWMQKRAMGDDFWPWIHSVRGKVTVINTQATGEIARVHVGYKVPGLIPTGKNKSRGYIAYVLQKAGLTLKQDWRQTQKVMQAADWILHAKGPYVFIALFGTAGGHAVAVDNSDGLLFMDPNVGEVSFPAPGNFMVWLPQFISLYSHRDGPNQPIKKFTTVAIRSYG